MQIESLTPTNQPGLSNSETIPPDKMVSKLTSGAENFFFACIDVCFFTYACSRQKKKKKKEAAAAARNRRWNHVLLHVCEGSVEQRARRLPLCVRVHV